MMKRVQCFLSVASILGWGACATFGAIYHVDQGHAAASDLNSGSSDQPLRTISAAVSRFQPADQVIVHAGVYREQVEMTGSGNGWDEAITLTAAPGEDVVIKGSDVVTGWIPHEDMIWKRPGWETNAQMVFSDGVRLQQIAGTMHPLLTDHGQWSGRVGNGIEDMMPGSFYYDLPTSTLYIWLANGGDPNQTTIEASVRRHLILAQGKYYIIRGFRMMHSNSSAEINWPAVVLSGEYGKFENNDVSWCDFIGMGFGGSHFEISSNQFNYCGNSGLTGRSRGEIRLIDNETSHNNWRKWDPTWHAGGIKLVVSVNGITVKGHKSFHNQGSGIWVDALDSSDITIEGCEIAYNLRHGIHYEVAKDGAILNNLAHHNGGRGIYLANSSDCLVAHNVVHANGMSGIVVLGANRAGPVEIVGPKGIVPARNNRVLGNILLDNAHPNLKPSDWSVRAELIMPNPENDPDLFGGCKSNYNIFYRSDERKIRYWFQFEESVWHTLGSWAAQTGNDTHSQEADPLFLDPEQGDYRVRSGSPAIELVPWLEEVPDDYAGAARPTAPDVPRTAGIHEYQP